MADGSLRIPIREKFAEVFRGEGYATGSLESAELHRLQGIVQRCYRDLMAAKGRVTDPAVLAVPIERYHTICEAVDHTALWTKINRTLSQADMERFLALRLVDELRAEIGAVSLSHGESGYPEIFWRIVRPAPWCDVGPLHADAWFWNLTHRNPDYVSLKAPDNHQRLKFWFSLWNECGENGLRIVPGSHERDYPYVEQFRDGYVKPYFDEAAHDLEPRLFRSRPGDFIVFHDKLLHAGGVGGVNTRVSFEFTLFVPDAYLREVLGIDP